MSLRRVHLIAGIFAASALAVAAACGDESTSSPADAGGDALAFEGARSEPDANRAESDGGPSDAGTDASDDASDAATRPASLLYVATMSGKVFVFGVDGSGALVPQPGSPAATGGVSAQSLLANAAGTRLYTGVIRVAASAGGVASFKLDAGGDIASAQAASPFATGVNATPTRMAVNPAGTRLYVAHQGTKPSIAVFALDAAGNIGALRSGSPFGTNTGTFSVSINHAGTRLYVASQEKQAVFVFGLDANGDVTGLRPGSPFGTGLTDAPTLSVVHTNDRRLYVTDQDAHVIVYALDANGDITGQTANSPLSGPKASFGIAMNAAGTRLYVGDLTNRRIEVYTLDKDTGDVIGAATSLGVDASPFDCALDVAQAHLFIADVNTPTLSVVSLNDAGDPESFVASAFDGGPPSAIVAR